MENKKGIKIPKLVNKQHEYEVEVGKHIILFNNNYQYIFIINELLLGLEFVVGSVFFFYESLKNAGIILFIIGSTQLFIRPVLKIAHAVSLKISSQHSSES